MKYMSKNTVGGITTETTVTDTTYSKRTYSMQGGQLRRLGGYTTSLHAMGYASLDAFLQANGNRFTRS